LAILRHALEHDRPCVVLATHSSELMPGCSPFFPTAASIERLYDRLDALFCAAAKNFRGMTLCEFRNQSAEYANPGGCELMALY
jgi:hypothetical protein